MSTTTTELGTWGNSVDRLSVSLENSVADAFGSEGPAGFDVDEIAAAWRAAINEALPDSVSLCGDTFYGPAYAADRNFDGYPLDEFGDLDIAAIVAGIDFWEIVGRHADDDE